MNYYGLSIPVIPIPVSISDYSHSVYFIYNYLYIN